MQVVNKFSLIVACICLPIITVYGNKFMGGGESRLKPWLHFFILNIIINKSKNVSIDLFKREEF